MLPFGKRVRIWRILRGLSQRELSRVSASRLDQAVIARHEAAQGTAPRQSTVEAYAETLGIPYPLLTGAAGRSALVDVFRPQSPWKRLAPEACNRIAADIGVLFPELCAELGLTEARLYRCRLGAVASLAGAGHRLVLLLPPDSSALAPALAAGIAATFGDRLRSGRIPVEQYLALLLDPVQALRRADLPEALRLEPAPGVAQLYRPPRPSTGVFLEFAGGGDQALRLIESCFPQGSILHLEVRCVEDFRANLPDEVSRYLSRHRLELDADGGLTRRK